MTTQPASGPTRRAGLWLVVALVALAAIVVAGAELTGGGSGRLSAPGLAGNPNLDPGTRLTGQAPGFTLTDQFDRPVSLRSFRGKVVILAFNDSKCTTICPLTTTAMVEARAMLGPAASRVQLLGIDANPHATSVSDVRSYSELHGMVRAWHFLTGSSAELERVWHAYRVDVAIEQGQIDHTPALFVIDPRGRLARLYLTQQSYAAVGQLGQLLAQESSRLLPGRPPVRARLAYREIQPVGPGMRTSLPRVGGGTVSLGPGTAPRLFLFFATWDQEVTDLGRQLESLDAYQQAARRAGLPQLTAVDEASVEPSPNSVSAFLQRLPVALAYPLAVDRSGRVADGYGVQDEPWLVLISSAGRILWYHDVATAGWLSRAALARQVRYALAHAPNGPLGPAGARAELAGSPPPLAAIHAQAGRLLGGEPALAARIRRLRGYPIVLNAWGSWCAPCRAEFGLFASASARYGRRVAFLGADVNDDPGDAHAFLVQHPVSYPSYQMATEQLTGILPQGVIATPTTIFISPGGRVDHVNTGQYEAQGSLDGDIETYALRGR